MQSADSEVRRGRRTMIFCSSVDSCRAVEHALRERGLPTLCYHGDVPLEERGRAMQEFSGTDDITRDPLASADVHASSQQDELNGPTRRKSGSNQRAQLKGASNEDGEVRPLLVCSDLAARYGLPLDAHSSAGASISKQMHGNATACQYAFSDCLCFLACLEVHYWYVMGFNLLQSAGAPCLLRSCIQSHPA